MAELINGEFELNNQLVFGTQRSGYPLAPGGFAIGSTSYRTQDTDNPAGDGFVFGVDTMEGITYTFKLTVFAEGPDRWNEVARLAQHFRTAWENRKFRSTSRTAVPLRIWHGGVPRTVYGRPRGFSMDRKEARKGIIHITCEFVGVDNLAYSDQLNQHQLSLVVPGRGGLTAPLVSPLTAGGEGTSRPTFITVEGETPVPVVIQFFGPITNPKITWGNGRWRAGWTGSIPYDMNVTIDTRLWNRSVMRSDGLQVGGSLTPDTNPLQELLLNPGTHELVFTGIDPTNTSYALVQWRDAVSAA